MEALGINVGFLFVQLLFLLALIVFPVITLINLATKKLSGIPLALWVLIICAVPFLGPLAYWIIKPTAENKN
jgi:antibiotic biosynthesis monooxygenase (ABM) superfamily enzyme